MNEKEDIMPRKSTYKTKQMDEIANYMKSVEGSHVTVGDLCKHFEESGCAVGTTTIYRNLEKMVEQGVVAKYTIDGTSGACFEYVGHHHDAAESHCYHCKCEKCGKIIHLECHEVESLGVHILEHHGFQIDYHRTVFYGLCDECAKQA